jgi:hypothetical protein
MTNMKGFGVVVGDETPQQTPNILIEWGAPEKMCLPFILR